MEDGALSFAKDLSNIARLRWTGSGVDDETLGQNMLTIGSSSANQLRLLNVSGESSSKKSVVSSAMSR